jgi:hypothetical protein
LVLEGTYYIPIANRPFPNILTHKSCIHVASVGSRTGPHYKYYGAVHTFFHFTLFSEPEKYLEKFKPSSISETFLYVWQAFISGHGDIFPDP